MKVPFIYTLLAIAPFGCNAPKNILEIKDSFLAIKVVSEMPFDIRNDSILKLKDEAIIYKSGKYNVYEEIVNSTTNILYEGKTIDSLMFSSAEKKNKILCFK